MKSRLFNGLFYASISALCALGWFASGSAHAALATEDEFSRWNAWVKKSLNNLDQETEKIERRQGTEPAPSVSGVPTEVAPPPPGYSTLSSCEGAAASLPACMAPSNLDEKPIMQSYFDFALVSQPGTQDLLAFDNYHSFVFIDINPTPNLSFSFNLLGPQTFPIYYELDYHPTKNLTLRAGKIFIPFDDLSLQTPHNIFGGRVGIQQLMAVPVTPGGTGNQGNTFLPSLWTELGVGVTYMFADTSALRLEGDFTVTNGFTPTTGADPLNGNVGPSFSEITPAPNSEGEFSQLARRNKSYDLRVHALVNNRVGIGGSLYTGQWNNDSGANNAPGRLYLSMEGLDLQIYVSRVVELRGGLAIMNVEYPEGTAQREGTYGELGLTFSKNWKGLLRYGTLQLDNRVPEATDVDVLAAEVLYNPGSVQFSLEHSRDVATPNILVGFTTYTALRMIMLF